MPAVSVRQRHGPALEGGAVSHVPPPLLLSQRTQIPIKAPGRDEPTTFRRVEWIALAVVALAGASVVYFTLRTGISPMPSNRLQRDAVLASIAEPGPIYELGAGWGTLAFALADRFPQMQVVAFELSWVPYGVMRVRQALRLRANLTLCRADFLNAPLSEGAVFVCYLYRGGMEALKTKLSHEAPGARLVTHTFSVHGWAPESEVTLADFYRTHVFLYRVPPLS